jgi:predicted dehydrogenase
VQSAKTAVEKHGLPSATKTYGDPQDLANDPDVELVVCCIRVDRHYEVIMPSLKAGKNAFVEWPLGSNLQQAEEMLAAAKQSGSRTIVGLQGRLSPITQKIKQLVADKTIGELLSSSFTYEFAGFGDTVRPGAEYCNTKVAGGNLFTVMFGHGADSVFYALGGLQEVSALLTTQWPETKLLKVDGSFDRMIKREVPDHVLLQGVLGINGAPVSISVRGGKPFKDAPALTWRVSGSKGDIRITSIAPINLTVAGEKIELYDHEKDTVEIVDVQFMDALKDLPPLAKNIGALYELFATVGGKEQGFVDFEQALVFHRIIHKMEMSSEGRKYETVAA